MEKEKIANLKRKLTAVSAAIICASACLFCCACGGNDSKQSGEASADAQNTIAYMDSLKGISVGDIVEFGAYEQDNDKSNGKEAIKWKTLAVEGGKALLISEYALDCMPFHVEFTSVTWETCALRNWLNNDFLNEAFDKKLQNCISTTKVTADRNTMYRTDPGNDTTDKVFLLSVLEAENYFENDDARKCAPTAYAKERGARIIKNMDYKTPSGEEACIWWLRTPGGNRLNATIVRSSGFIGEGGNIVFDDGTSEDSEYINGNAVRPAIWVNIEPVDQTSSEQLEESSSASQN